MLFVALNKKSNVSTLKCFKSYTILDLQNLIVMVIGLYDEDTLARKKQLCIEQLRLPIIVYTKVRQPVTFNSTF